MTANKHIPLALQTRGVEDAKVEIDRVLTGPMWQWLTSGSTHSRLCRRRWAGPVVRSWRRTFRTTRQLHRWRRRARSLSDPQRRPRSYRVGGAEGLCMRTQEGPGGGRERAARRCSWKLQGCIFPGQLVASTPLDGGEATPVHAIPDARRRHKPSPAPVSGVAFASVRRPGARPTAGVARWPCNLGYLGDQGLIHFRD